MKRNKKGGIIIGTRGCYGFRIDKQDKIQYNHWDSYPTGLGKDVMEFIKDTPIEEMKKIAREIVLVDEDSKPTEEQINECKKWADTSVSSGKLDEWYVLLRETQGNLSVYKKGLKYMIGSHTFLKDSLFCEWAYIINLDTGMFEIYKGFNTSPNGRGRYAKLKLERNTGEYYGVSLFKEIPISEIQKMRDIDIDLLCDDLEVEEEE